MISALIQGNLIGDPRRRIASNAKPFVTATLRVPAGADAVLVGVIAFSEPARAALSRLRGGDSMAASGSLELNLWQGREGEQRRDWRLIVSQVMSLYELRKRRADPPSEAAL